jgi:hypothetical protein
MLLGWIAGTMAVTDPAIVGYMPTTPASKPGLPPEVNDMVRYGAGVAGALFVLAWGKWAASRRKPPARSAA